MEAELVVDLFLGYGQEIEQVDFPTIFRDIRGVNMGTIAKNYNL